MAREIYFLDSNAFSFILRGVEAYETGIAALPVGSIFIPSPVYDEITRGLQNPRCTFTEEQRSIILRELDGYPLAPLNSETIRIELQQSAELKSRGKPIGDWDVKIASVTIAADATLVTDNIKHFGRIRGLKILTFAPEQQLKLALIQQAHIVAEAEIASAMREGKAHLWERKALTKLDADIDQALANA